MNIDSKTLISNLEQLEADRENWHTVFDEINKYVFPFKKSVYYDYDPEQNIVGDSIVDMAIKRLASSIGGELTNPTSTWLGFKTDNPSLNNKDSTKEYFDALSKAILSNLDNSNFYTEVYKMYIDMVTYGTGILYAELSRDPMRELTFSTVSILDTYIDENNEGIVDRVFRRFSMTARQLIQEFGEKNVSEKCREMYEKNPLEYIEILHAVFPRKERKMNKKDTKNMKYASVWIEIKNNHKLRESGYNTFPYIVARWLKETGEVYGRSPTMTALPDIKTATLMLDTLLMTGQKIADPILMVPSNAFADVTGEPGQIIAYDTVTNVKIEPVNIGANLPITMDMFNMVVERIKDCFFTNQLIIQTGNRERVTAEEIRARQSEKASLFGPVYGTLHYETIPSLVERVYDLLSQRLLPDGSPLLPLEPSDLTGQNARLQFMSPLAKSQRIHELQSIEASVNIIMSLAQASPDVIDWIDFDKVAISTADILGAAGIVLRSEDQVISIRDQKAKQKQLEQEMALRQAQAQVLKAGMAGVKDMSDALNQGV